MPKNPLQLRVKCAVVDSLDASTARLHAAVDVKITTNVTLKLKFLNTIQLHGFVNFVKDFSVDILFCGYTYVSFFYSIDRRDDES